MPKNKGKGGKNKRKGKNVTTVTRELVTKKIGQEYGQVTKILGNCRLEIKFADGTIRLGHIKGKIGKRVWILKDDVVLVELRDYQDSKCDVVGKYTLHEVQALKKMKEIPASFTTAEIDEDDDDEYDDISHYQTQNDEFKSEDESSSSDSSTSD